MKLSRFGVNLVIGGFVMGFLETVFFGSHWLPSCVEELYADLFCMAFSFVGIAFIFSEK